LKKIGETTEIFGETTSIFYKEIWFFQNCIPTIFKKQPQKELEPSFASSYVVGINVNKQN
jgi:hypothetical protein